MGFLGMRIRLWIIIINKGKERWGLDRRETRNAMS